MTWRDRALQERPDRSSPSLSFETLRAAIRCNDPLLAYRLLSEDMKARENLTDLLFSTGWDEFFSKYPLARLAGNAEILSVLTNARGDAVVTASAHGRRIESTWTREHYYEIWVRGRGKIDGFLDRLSAQLSHGENDPGEFIARCSDPRLADVDVKDVTSFHVATEWKLLEFQRK